MVIEQKIRKGYLKVPIETGAVNVPIKITAHTHIDSENERVLFQGMVPISEKKVDFWGRVVINDFDEAVLRVEIKEGEKEKWTAGIHWEEWKNNNNGQSPVFHITPPSGSFQNILRLRSLGRKWEAEYKYDPFGADSEREVLVKTGCGRNIGQMEEQMDVSVYRKTHKSVDALMNRKRYIEGDIEEEYIFDDGNLCIGKSRIFNWENFSFFNVLTPPLFLEKKENGEIILSGGKEMEKFRIWKREWEDVPAAEKFGESLRFRVKPSVWPNIELISPEGKQDDVTAKAFEIHLELRLEKGKHIKMNLCGFSGRYDQEERIFYAGDASVPVTGEKLCLTAYIDIGCAEFICGEKAIFCLQQSVQGEFLHVDNTVSGNLEKCKVETCESPEIQIWSEDGIFQIVHLEVYGLKKKENTDLYLERFGIDKIKDPVFYKSAEFTVYHHYVRDKNYGYPDAVALTDKIVVSPVRVVEEFSWRKTPWGDMTRVVNREDIWRGYAALIRYPQIHSPVTTLNAAYQIALDVFEQCKRKKYALNGQAGLWSAGLFQGPGEGFGVWLRDSTHILLRCGALVDPEGAKNTIRFAMEKGFDNGSDGLAMGAVGLWDYYLVTGNTDILYEMWPRLIESTMEADKRFDEEKGLVMAENSTSNDAFPEPENDGFSLSTECYFMKAYESMAAIAELIEYGEVDKIKEWKQKSETIRRMIKDQYWNPQYGYYTSGPKGSKSYHEGFWETSGQESVLWTKFEIASQEQRRLILQNLESVAMTEYGIKLFPYRKEKNHFCGSVWGVWQAGFASAASLEGNCELVRRLLAQQIRVCLMNKTFYEVIDADNGISWRWPGQLWNAAGFISLIFYGVFGIEYNIRGMYFHPAVSKELADISLKDLPYRKMILDIKACGWGTVIKKLEIDGRISDYVEGSMEGRHQVVLYLAQGK